LPSLSDNVLLSGAAFVFVFLRFLWGLPSFGFPPCTPCLVGSFLLELVFLSVVLLSGVFLVSCFVYLRLPLSCLLRCRDFFSSVRLSNPGVVVTSFFVSLLLLLVHAVQMDPNTRIFFLLFLSTNRGTFSTPSVFRSPPKCFPELEPCLPRNLPHFVSPIVVSAS